MTGTMRERKPGVWEVRVYTGRDPVTGSPRQVSRTVHGGRRSASKALAALVTAAGDGKVGGTSATVGLLLDRYLEHLDAQDLSPKTLDDYQRYVAGVLKPALGAIPVNKLTAWDLDRMYAGGTAKGRKATTIRLWHAILSGALGQAVRWGWVPVNVAKMASPPPVRSAPIVPPTAAEVLALVDAAETKDPTYAALILLAALTGARRGELCALRWSDIDLPAGRMTVARSLLDLPGRDPIEKGTKTGKVRTIALGDAGVALLTQHGQRVLERAREGEVDVQPDGFVFSEWISGAGPIRPAAVTRFFSRVRDDLELGHVHLHSLRHFMATELAGRGDVSVRTLAGRLGHADASLTMRVYSHFFPAADLQAADHMGRALEPPR